MSQDRQGAALKHPGLCAEYLSHSSQLCCCGPWITNLQTWNWVVCFQLGPAVCPVMYHEAYCTSSLRFLASQCPQQSPSAGADRNNSSWQDWQEAFRPYRQLQPPLYSNNISITQTFTGSLSILQKIHDKDNTTDCWLIETLRLLFAFLLLSQRVGCHSKRSSSSAVLCKQWKDTAHAHPAGVSVILQINCNPTSTTGLE